ncbi:hypothetical protein Taro_030087 [Colocasia esculenta]|uniref:Uncharacterized protein n=1 Tax=Colocasia esculenta TaxID=4460 RepID=A0A843VQW3_COLES|nr:hypothetical protein [Colocasia esculenta]
MGTKKSTTHSSQARPAPERQGSTASKAAHEHLGKRELDSTTSTANTTSSQARAHTHSHKVGLVGSVCSASRHHRISQP